MKVRSLRFVCCFVILFVIPVASLWGQSVVFTYNNFTAPTANLQANGDAGSVGSVMRLTTTQAGQSGSVWYYGGTADAPQPVSLINGFTTTFQFQISGVKPPVMPADGIAFVIQNGTFAPNPAVPCPAQNGTSGIFAWEQRDINCGGDIGYAGLTHSLAIEFDDFQNPWDLDANHVAVQSCGVNANSADHTSACFVARTTPQTPLKSVISDGNPHTAVIQYANPNCGVEICLNPNNLHIFVDGVLALTATFDLASLGLDENLHAFPGFVGRTGGLDANQDVLTWSFSTTQPPTPISQTTPTTITATFNNNANNLVQEIITITPGNGTVVQAGTSMQVSNQAILPATWQSTWVDGTPFATSSCWPHNGEGSNCKLYIDLCTTTASPVPSGANCPTSNPPSIVVEDNFDGPKIDPATLPPGTGFALLEGPDTWQGGPCTFPANSPAAGQPCPLNLLTSVTGDPTVTSKVPHFNSTMIAASGVAQPGTLIALSPAPNMNHWINNNGVANPIVSATFTTSTQAPPVPNTFNYVQPFVAQLIYSLTSTANPGSPIASGTLTPSTPPVTAFTPPPVNFGPLADGQYLLDYQGQDDHGTRELLFSLVNNVYSTFDKTLPINVDTTAPNVTVSLSSSKVYLNGYDQATVRCSDALSGVVLCGTQTFNPAVLSTPALVFAANTSQPGPQTYTASVQDAAGNSNSASASYTDIYRFRGFFVPETGEEDDYPEIETWKAGVDLPLGFKLLDANYAPVTNMTVINVTAYSSAKCSGQNPVPVPVSGTLVNRGSGNYAYVVHTAGLSGLYVTFQATLQDGTVRRVNVLFK